MDDDDDCCACCDTLCEAICGPDDDECGCCAPCCSWIPGCEPSATPDCMRTGWCVRRDCCGVFCASLSLVVILLTDSTVITCVIAPWFKWNWLGYVHCALFSVITFLAAASHVACMTTCPGVMPRDVVPLQELAAQGQIQRGQRGVVPICRKCHNYKLKGVHHCSTCNLCVERMDHHCPWVNNCVGRYNQKYFVLFLLYVTLGESYGLLLFLSRALHCSVYPELCGEDKTQFRVVVCVLVGFISALFLAFVCAIGGEQYEGIRDDLPKIDRLQNRTNEDSEQTVYEGLVIVFGEEWYSILTKI